jgi:hypothetical protein
MWKRAANETPRARGSVLEIDSQYRRTDYHFSKRPEQELRRQPRRVVRVEGATLTRVAPTISQMIMSPLGITKIEGFIGTYGELVRPPRVATSMGAARRRQGRKPASQPRPASRTRLVGGRRLDPGRHRRDPHRHAARIAEGAAALARLHQHHRGCMSTVRRVF